MVVLEEGWERYVRQPAREAGVAAPTITNHGQRPRYQEGPPRGPST